MINLLPPAHKEEVLYAKHNAAMLRYIFLVIAILAVLAGGLIGARLYQQHQIAVAQADVDAKTAATHKYAPLEQKAGLLSSRLASIQTIQKNQSKFSILLNDLAQYMPQGTAISSITLTGDYTKPIRLTVTAVDYKTALSFRDSITRSKRISAADIETVGTSGTTKNSNYQVVVSFAFSPGGAK